MRKLWLGIIGLAAASTANAAVVTYTLSYNDDGTGTPTDGVFAVYADDSSDNGGIFGLGVDLQGPVDFLGNTLQGVSWKKSTIPTNTKFAGMLAGFATDPAAFKVSGLQDLSKGADMIPVRGLGQVAGDLNSLKPDVAHGTFTDINGNGTTYGAKLLVAVGTVAAGANIHDIKFERSSVDNVASVWQDSSGTGTANFKATLNYVDGVVGDVFNVTGTAANANQAVGGSIAVSGSNGLYSSEVDQLLDPSANKGSAPVASIGDENGTLFVMAKVTGDAAAVSSILNQFNNGAGNAEAAHLHQLYDSQFGAGGFNLLFATPNIQGAKVVNWDFSGGANAGATIDQLAVVPEPATMSLLGLGALGLLARRRRNA